MGGWYERPLYRNLLCTVRSIIRHSVFVVVRTVGTIQRLTDLLAFCIRYYYELFEFYAKTNDSLDLSETVMGFF